MFMRQYCGNNSLVHVLLYTVRTWFGDDQQNRRLKVTYNSQQKSQVEVHRKETIPHWARRARVEEVPRWWCPPFYLAPFTHSTGSPNGGPGSQRCLTVICTGSRKGAASGWPDSLGEREIPSQSLHPPLSSPLAPARSTAPFFQPTRHQSQ